MTAVSVRDVSIAYAERRVIDRLSMDVGEGEAVRLTGPSGCGKSTLLHAICGLIPGSIDAELSGEVLLCGKPVLSLSRAERAALIGIVFQNPDTQMFSDTVEDELAFGMENLCLTRAEMHARIDELLHLTGLSSLRLASPRQLSGGQKQLVVMASVLALRPKILLLDEALSQLDESGRSTLAVHIAALKRAGTTLIMVEHDDALAHVADRAVALEAWD